jgi:hypothetical protein
MRVASPDLAGLVYRAMGFPPQFFTVLFAVPRVAGYLAHWREQLSDPDVKIARPQQNYTVRPASLIPSIQDPQGRSCACHRQKLQLVHVTAKNSYKYGLGWWRSTLTPTDSYFGV